MRLRRRNIFGSIFLAGVFALLYSCATNVRTLNPSANDLSDYETFAYLPNTNVEVEGKNYTDTTVNRSIVEAVRINLQQEGYKLDRKNPDMLVLISTSTNVEVETDTDPVYAAYPYNYGVPTVSPYYDAYFYYDYPAYKQVIGYNTTTYTYEEGTLVIDLIDRKSHKTIWKGIASSDIYNQSSAAAIRGMVDDIFDEFPSEKVNQEKESASNN